MRIEKVSDLAKSTTKERVHPLLAQFIGSKSKNLRFWMVWKEENPELYIELNGNKEDSIQVNSGVNSDYLVEKEGVFGLVNNNDLSKIMFDQ